MSLPFRQGKAWRVFSMAVIAVPWFMRDQLASTLDRHTQTAQQVMDALRSERQRQARDYEQRDTSQRLQRIEIDVLRLAKSSTDQKADEAMAQARIQELHDEAEALSSSVGELKPCWPTYPWTRTSASAPARRLGERLSLRGLGSDDPGRPDDRWLAEGPGPRG